MCSLWLGTVVNTHCVTWIEQWGKMHPNDCWLCDAETNAAHSLFFAPQDSSISHNTLHWTDKRSHAIGIHDQLWRSQVWEQFVARTASNSSKFTQQRRGGGPRAWEELSMLRTSIFPSLALGHFPSVKHHWSFLRTAKSADAFFFFSFLFCLVCITIAARQDAAD